MGGMDETFVLLREWINISDNFELDADEKGTQRRDEMIEKILLWDIAEKPSSEPIVKKCTPPFEFAPTKTKMHPRGINGSNAKLYQYTVIRQNS